MPTGTPYNSFIPPYRIRVDDFGSAANANPEETPLLHLLTHTHTDHINGLSAKSFGFNVVCSYDAKRMLLKHEVYAERELQALELRGETIRTYSHLRIEPIIHPDGSQYNHGSRDLLRPLPLNTPTQFELDANETVTITAFDANHCPGSVMYLIEGDKGAVLHTGDFRAEPWFLESICRNPSLQPYLSPTLEQSENDDIDKAPPFVLSKTLETIYLDTANVFSTINIPTKKSATSGLIDLMKCFPSSVYFFINSWTWGYEDILKAIAREFQSRIHVDRYKHRIYNNISDSILGHITTQDPSSTRFHACERFDRCSYVAVEDDLAHTKSTNFEGKRVIYVNPVSMDVEKWATYCEDTKTSISLRKEINHLLVPLSRHSPLPELQEFVKLFRPKSVVPNTLDPRLLNLDWACIDSIFSSCLYPNTKQEGSPFALRLGISAKEKIAADVQIDDDVALKNLVGRGASILAAQWTDHGNTIKKISAVRKYLNQEENAMIDALLGVSKARPRLNLGEPSSETSEIQLVDKGKGKQVVLSRYNNRDSEDDTDNDFSDDERARTAHLLFADLAGIDPDDKENACWLTSEASQEQLEPDVLDELIPAKGPGRGEPVHDGARRLNRLTPESSPIRARRHTPKHSSTPIPIRSAIQNPIQNPSTSSHSQIAKAKSFTPTACKAGSGHSHKSPICLLSSPDTPSKLRPLPNLFARPALSRIGHPTSGNSRTSVYPLRRKSSTQTQENMISSSTCVNPGRRDVPAQSSSSKQMEALQSSIISTTKRARADDFSSSLTIPKKPRSEISEISGHVDGHLNAPSTSQIKPLLPISPSLVITSPPSDREELHLGRLKMAHELSVEYADLIQPSYKKKRSRQLARVDRKQKSQEASIAKTINPRVSLASSSKPLALAKTIASFEPVEEDDSGMDWNRSRQLADAAREDAVNGRRVILPALQCAESQY